MKQSVENLLKNIDQFGASFQQQFGRNQFIYRSMIGGIVTFLVFSLSLSYAMYVAYQWQTNQFLPKISSSGFITDFKSLDLNYDVVQFYHLKFRGNLIDPFENNILIPIVTYTQNNQFVESIVLQPANETSSDGNRLFIPKMKLGFTELQGNLINTAEMFISFVKCNQSLLLETEQCASHELVQQFYQQPGNQIIIYLKYKKVNSQDKSIQTSLQGYALPIDQSLCIQQLFFLQTTLFQIQDSLLFQAPTQYELITGAQVYTVTNSLDYCKLAYFQETYASIYVRMKSAQIKEIYEYPNLGDLLANIGSIISIIFFIRHFIVFLNNKLLREKIITQLITLYYDSENFNSYTQNIKISRQKRIGKEQLHKFITKRHVQMIRKENSSENFYQKQFRKQS